MLRELLPLRRARGNPFDALLTFLQLLPFPVRVHFKSDNVRRLQDRVILVLGEQCAFVENSSAGRVMADIEAGGNVIRYIAGK